MSAFEILHYFPSIFRAFLSDFIAFSRQTIKIEKYRNQNIYLWNSTEISDDSIVGPYTYIGKNSSITRAKVGRYCSVANNVSIGPSQHPRSEISTWVSHIDTYDLLYEKECIVGNDVWIGVNSVIKRGVRIGDSAIIGANSFVNTDIPEFSVAAGSPARIIGQRFPEKTIELIKNSHWWDYDAEEAQKIKSDLREKIKTGVQQTDDFRMK
jgi:virginiamycin A acetyltransferase